MIGPLRREESEDDSDQASLESDCQPRCSRFGLEVYKTRNTMERKENMLHEPRGVMG